MKDALKYLAVGLLCAASVPLLILPDWKWLGWSLLIGLLVASAMRYKTTFGKHMLLLTVAMAMLGLVPISTDISFRHMTLMGVVLAAAVLVPYVVSKRYLHENTIVFPFDFKRSWSRREFAYIAFAALASYLILPYYLSSTGSYLNWRAPWEAGHIVRLFIGTNALGIWDELFFVGVCLALLRKHLPFVAANGVQAFLWAVFLYELGFRGWGPIAIFLFAITQGYIFKRSRSLVFIVAVHLTIDFMLFLTLLHLHNPDHLRIFLTSPF